jgi:hypothetical protein
LPFALCALLLAGCLHRDPLEAGAHAEPKPAPKGKAAGRRALRLRGPGGYEARAGAVSGEPLARPLAVMIENHAAARPQSGLAQADLVFEALAEGGITRFLALYRADNAPVIGPIRSARPYFIDLMQAFDPVYVHCGQSIEAERILAERQVDEINEITDHRPFWRDARRRKPHNLYASSASLQREARRLAMAAGRVPWPLDVSETPLDGKPCASLSLAYRAGQTYTVGYQYDRARNEYRRLINGRPHLDAGTGRCLTARTVILQETPTRPLGGKLGELEMDVVGTGRCWFVRDGCCVQAAWRKDAAETAISYRTYSGDRLAVAPGPVWVQIFPEGTLPRFSRR